MLPELPPDIVLDDSGTCQICASASQHAAPPPRESELTRTITRLRPKRKRRYDCLVVCTGSLASVAALHHVCRRYKLEPVVHIFDNGFLRPAAVENVRRATEALGVDLQYLRSSYLRPLFRELVRSGAPVPICSVCQTWIMDEALAAARHWGVSLVFIGGSRGWMGSSAANGALTFPSWQRATREFLVRCCQREPRYRRLLSAHRRLEKARRKVAVLSPLWYLPDDPQRQERLLREELGWQPLAANYPSDRSSDCDLNLVGVYSCLRDYGFTTYHAEHSQLIRLGESSRQEALAALDVALDREPYAPIIEDVLQRLDCSWADLQRDADSG